MNYLGFNGPGSTDRFDPYLRQVLEKRRPNHPPPRYTVEVARERLLNPSDLIKSWGDKPTGLDRVVAQFIDDLVRMYYMGAAEYEYGAIPQALGFLCQARDLVSGEYTATDIKPNWWRGNRNYDETMKNFKRAKTVKKPKVDTKAVPKSVTFYYIGPSEYAPFINKLVQDTASGKAPNKNGDRHDAILDPINAIDRQSIGWLCIDYPFILVKDRGTYDQLHRLFFGRAP